jgi:hypothetical protein
MRLIEKLLVIFAAALVIVAPSAADAAESKPFTVVMMPDTQVYAERFPGTFFAQAQWIADNAEKENVVFVTQVGDIVNNGGKATKEWEVADAAMRRLDAVSPWGVALGNHDYDRVDDIDGSTVFNRYFGRKRFEGRRWFGGGTDDGRCSYQFFTAASQKFLVLHLPFEARDRYLKWAGDVLDKHPNLPTIVSTHHYLAGRPQDKKKYFATAARPGFNSPAAIRKKLVLKHPQIFLVVCGHVPTPLPAYHMDKNEAGHDVIALLADFQDLPEGGQGWLVLLTFDPAKDEIRVRTYSPTKKKYMETAGSQFTLPYNVVRQRLTDAKKPAGGG